MGHPNSPQIIKVPPYSMPLIRPWRAQFLGLLTIAVVFLAVAASPISWTVPGTATLAPGAYGANTGSGRVPVTVDNLRGAWYMPALADGSIIPVVARFSADGSFVLGGVLDDLGGPDADDSWATGDFQARPTGITFHPTGGWCGATQNFAWHVAIGADGRMEAVHLGSNGLDRNKIGRCSVLVGATFYLSQVSPQSPAGIGAAAEYLKPDRPISGTYSGRLNRYWLVAGTGLLLRVTGNTYVLDDAGELGATAFDAGTLVIADNRIRLISGPAAVRCRAGNELTIIDARIEAGALQGTAAGDNCARGLHGPIALLHLDPTRP